MKKILWAVDPFQTESEIFSYCAEMVLGLTEAADCEAEPVYVLSPEQLSMGKELGLDWVDHVESSSQMGQGSAQSPRIRKPKVLVQKASGTSSAVQALANYAEAKKADLIVLGTHGRKGVSRFFLGSFAETLLFISKTPILVINPKTKPVEKVTEILFPTDLGVASRKLFPKVLKLVKKMGAELVIFHAFQNPSGPALKASSVSMSAFIQEEMRARTKNAEHWVKLARRVGVKAELVIETSGDGVSSAILAAAKKRKSSWIAMASVSGAMTSALIGSVSRQVVRESPCPVWVLHETGKKKKS